VEFIACNTDAQSLSHSKADVKIQLGDNITQGLGACAKPEVGRAAAEEALDDILDHLQGAHMVFLTAGMGGGTGSGAGPVIARAARDQGILTIGVVTKPFQFEGAYRMKLAEQAIDELQQVVDTLLVIPNQNLFRLANENTTFADAFKMADDVLHSGVRGVTDLMVMPGLINLDFADIRSVMGEMGKAMMGTGHAEGETRAVEAAEAAISNPLLDDVSMQGARGVLINITGGMDMTLFEVDEACNRIRDEVEEEANIIFGSTFNESLEGKIRVSVVATGIDGENIQQQPDQTSGFQRSGQQIRQNPDQRSDVLTAGYGQRKQEPQTAVSQFFTGGGSASNQRKQSHSTATQTSTGGDQFIPDEPMNAPEEEQISGHDDLTAQRPTDPFVEADLANADKQGQHQTQPAEPAKKKSGLFDRFTRGDDDQTDQATTQKPSPAGAQQSSLAVDMQEDEDLEIPAFLRRQAN